MAIEINVTESAKGVPAVDAVNEQQTLVAGGMSDGTFRLEWSANSTAALYYDSSALVVQEALTGIVGAGNVTCSGMGLPADPVLIEFVGALAASEVQDIAVVENLTNGSPSVSETRSHVEAAAAINEVEKIAFVSAPSSGTWTVAYNGTTSGSLNYNASAEDVEAALVGLSTIGSGNAGVTGSTSGGFYVTFQNTLGGQDIADGLLSADGSGLSGGSIEVTPSPVTMTITVVAPTAVVGQNVAVSPVTMTITVVAPTVTQSGDRYLAAFILLIG